MNSPCAGTLCADERDDREDDGVRIRGEEVDGLTLSEETVGTEPVERGRLEVGDDEDEER